MRGRFDSELVSVSQWLNVRTPVRKTGDLRFKSELRGNFYLNIYHIKNVSNENTLFYKCLLEDIYHSSKYYTFFTMTTSFDCTQSLSRP